MVVTGFVVVGLAVEPPEGFALELLDPLDGLELVPLEWLALPEFAELPVLPLVFEPVELLLSAEVLESVAPDTFAGVVVLAGAVFAASAAFSAVVAETSSPSAAVTSSANGKVVCAGSVFKCRTVNAVTPVSAANSTAAATVTAAIVFSISS